MVYHFGYACILNDIRSGKIKSRCRGFKNTEFYCLKRSRSRSHPIERAAATLQAVFQVCGRPTAAVQELWTVCQELWKPSVESYRSG